jgi:hypothetical protein
MINDMVRNSLARQAKLHLKVFGSKLDRPKLPDWREAIYQKSAMATVD